MKSMDNLKVSVRILFADYPTLLVDKLTIQPVVHYLSSG